MGSGGRGGELGDEPVGFGEVAMVIRLAVGNEVNDPRDDLGH